MQFDQLKRREFITLLGSAAAAWPLAARAQQPRRMRRIGVLTPYPADDAEGHARLTAFAQALQQSGWTVGQNVRIEYRWGPGNADTMRKYATDWPLLAPPSRHCWRQAAPSQSCSRLLPTRLPPAMSRAWRGRAATPPALPSSNIQPAGNGWSYSRRSHRA